MISSFVDVLLVGSMAAFAIGIISIFLKQIRIRKKIRYYFIMSAFLFGAALTFGWQDAVDGFVKGLNDSRVECSDTENEVDSVTSDRPN